MNNHQCTQELLPWYANGTLVGEEYAVVHRHLKQCVLCQKELAQQEILSQALSAEVALSDSATANLTDLQPQLHTNSTSNIWSNFVRSLRQTPLTSRFVMTAQFAMLAALVTYQFLPDTTETIVTGYTTLSSAHQSNGDLRLVFSVDSTKNERQKLLNTAGLELVEPISDRGIATVRWSEQHQLNLLNSLRARPEIEFVEPINYTAK